jgi:hypothetical protein
MSYQPGPKELQLQALKEAKASRKGKKPSSADLRNTIAKVKPMTKRGGKRGR